MRLLLLALVLALTAPQDKVTLKFNPKQGDRLSKSEKMEMSIKAKVVFGDQTQEFEIEQKEIEKSTLEYKEVVDGKVARTVFKCTENVEEKKAPPTLQWEKKEKGLHGRRLEIYMKDGKLVREGSEGIEEKLLKKLDLTDRTSLIYPKNAVGVGESWEVTGEDVRSFLGADADLKEASIKMKLLEVKEIEGRRCAVFNAIIDITGKAEGEFDMTMKLDTEVVVWIERGYALSVKGKGSMSMKGANAQFTMTGTGPMSLEITNKIE